MTHLSDEEIARLLLVPKRVLNPAARRKDQKSSQATNFDLISDDGLDFQLYVRQNVRVPIAFSCGLVYLRHGGDPVTLTRYNGSDHPHSNPLEGTSFSEVCHIHTATLRYAENGRKTEHYAIETTSYTDCVGAFRAILADCNIRGFPNEYPQEQAPLL